MSGIRQSARRRRVPAAIALAALCFGLSGCGPMIASMPLVGEPADAQKRPEIQPGYPAAFRQPADSEICKPRATALRQSGGSRSTSHRPGLPIDGARPRGARSVARRLAQGRLPRHDMAGAADLRLVSRWP
jgi:hypothetical protein